MLQDKLDTIRLLVIGVSAHQKLELLERLVTQLGYDSLTVFGDCFDEVWLYGDWGFGGSAQLPALSMRVQGRPGHSAFRCMQCS